MQMNYEARVRKFLEPYLAVLNRIIVDAWNEYNNGSYDELTSKLLPLGRAIMMNNIVIANAKAAFLGDPNVTIMTNGNGVILTILSKEEKFQIDLRFKKLDRQYQTHNAVSARNTRFNDQMSLWEDPLPETISLVNINAGWRINETWSSIEVWITCPNGEKSIAWKFKLSDDGQEKAMTEPETLPVAPSSTQIRTRVIATKQTTTEEIKKRKNE
jgi:hypothetical protein